MGPLGWGLSPRKRSVHFQSHKDAIWTGSSLVCIYVCLSVSLHRHVYTHVSLLLFLSLSLTQLMRKKEKSSQKRFKVLNKYWKIALQKSVLIYAHYNWPITAWSIMIDFIRCSFARGESVFLFNLQLFDYQGGSTFSCLLIICNYTIMNFPFCPSPYSLHILQCLKRLAIFLSTLLEKKITVLSIQDFVNLSFWEVYLIWETCVIKSYVILRASWDFTVILKRCLVM